MQNSSHSRSNKNNTSNMSTNNSNNNQRICENTMCRTTRTPLWRKGWIAERGRKVRLCNACGLHFRKGHFCRYCNQVYRDTCEAEMIQEGWIMCRRCERWVHKKCAKNNHESLSTAGAPSDEEQQQSPSISTEFSSFSNTSYQCSDCTTSIRTSRAQSAPLSLPHSLPRQITSDSAATVSPIPLEQHQPHHDNRTALHEPHSIESRVSSLRDAQSYHHPPQQLHIVLASDEPIPLERCFGVGERLAFRHVDRHPGDRVLQSLDRDVLVISHVFKTPPCPFRSCAQQCHTK